MTHVRTRDLQQDWREHYDNPDTVIQLLCQRVLNLAAQQKRMGLKNRTMRKALRAQFEVIRSLKNDHSS